MPQDEAACALGQHYRKKYLLTQIYVARTIAAAAFILAPMTPGSVLVFSFLMSTLYSIVFLSHQIGGFLGVWLGGTLYTVAVSDLDSSRKTC